MTLDYATRARDQFAALAAAGYGAKDCSILIRLINGSIAVD
jgi:hypothetical protein